MQYADLTVNGNVTFTGQPCFNMVFVGGQKYQQYSGAFFFYDPQGTLDPAWQGLAARYDFLYRYADGVTLGQLLLQATPNQTLYAVLDGQNVAINLYEQVLATALPSSSALPVGADQGYLNQQFLAPNVHYADATYWDSTYAV